jgi:hypothetical protein
VGGSTEKEAMANPTGAYLALRKLWADLPATMRTNMDTNPIGDPALTEIIRLCGLYEGDFAGASGRLRMLLASGALKVRGPFDGWHELTRAPDFPEPDNPADWVEKANQDIRRRVAEEEARRKTELETAQANQQILNAPAAEAERRAMAALLDEHGLSPEKLAATIEAAIEKALQAHGLQLETVSAGNGSRER